MYTLLMLPVCCVRLGWLVGLIFGGLGEKALSDRLIHRLSEKIFIDGLDGLVFSMLVRQLCLIGHPTCKTLLSRGHTDHAYLVGPVLFIDAWARSNCVCGTCGHCDACVFPIFATLVQSPPI